MMQAAIAANIRQQRARVDIRQEKLAEAMRELGFGQWGRQTVSQVEHGRRRVTADEIAGLAEILGTDVQTLMARDGTAPAPPPRAPAPTPAPSNGTAMVGMTIEDRVEYILAAVPMEFAPSRSWVIRLAFALADDSVMARCEGLVSQITSLTEQLSQELRQERSALTADLSQELHQLVGPLEAEA